MSLCPLVDLCSKLLERDNKLIGLEVCSIQQLRAHRSSPHSTHHRRMFADICLISDLFLLCPLCHLCSAPCDCIPLVVGFTQWISYSSDPQATLSSERSCSLHRHRFHINSTTTYHHSKSGNQAMDQHPIKRDRDRSHEHHSFLSLSSPSSVDET